MKEHTKETLMNYTKKELVEHYMCLQHNNNVLRKRFEIQYQNCLNIVNNMSLLNDQFNFVKKEGK